MAPLHHQHPAVHVERLAGDVGHNPLGNYEFFVTIGATAIVLPGFILLGAKTL